MKKRRLTIFLSIAAILLLIPFLAMQFSDEVSWSLFDFLIAGFLFVSSAFLIDFILNKVRKKSYRILLSLVVLLLLVILWVELAVGIFGSVIAGT
jgi:hypothetical protein